jgi:hypothetical protein
MGRSAIFLTLPLQWRCQEEQKDKDTDFRQVSEKQQAALADKTIKLEEGLFPTFLEEAWRQYHCQRVHVIRRNSDLCHNEMI